MKIAICEDEEVMAKKLWNMLFDMPDMEAKYFLNPVDLLRCCEAGETFDIFFCDVKGTLKGCRGNYYIERAGYPLCGDQGQGSLYLL